MKDPYEVLGLSRGADPETVKKAYRELVQKYHPDKYAGNPLEDLAQEKMKEINEAYDAIMKGNGNSTYASGSYGGNASGGYGGSAVFAEVRRLIQLGQYQEAENQLNAMGNHTAEWYYLKGMIAMRRGWMDEAQQNFRIAMSMDPGNMEYRNAFNSVSGSGPFSFRGQRMATDDSTTSACRDCCDLCQCLICLDCLCDCI